MWIKDGKRVKNGPPPKKKKLIFYHVQKSQISALSVVDAKIEISNVMRTKKQENLCKSLFIWELSITVLSSTHRKPMGVLFTA